MRSLCPCRRGSWNPRAATVYRFQKTLTGYGYDTYLINAGDATSGVVLVPMHGDFWHNDLEISTVRTSTKKATAGMTYSLCGKVHVCARGAVWQRAAPDARVAREGSGRYAFGWRDWPLSGSMDAAVRGTLQLFVGTHRAHVRVGR